MLRGFRVALALSAVISPTVTLNALPKYVIQSASTARPDTGNDTQDDAKRGSSREEWNGFRGPRRDGVARHANPPVAWSNDENVAWRVDLPGPGASSPIVHGKLVIVICYTGYGNHLDDGGKLEDLVLHVIAFDRTNGSKVWQYDLNAPLAKKPPQMQTTEHGFATPTPTCDDERIYAYLGHAGMLALDLDGKEVWRVDTGTPNPDAPPPTNQVVRDGKTLSLRWGAAGSPLLAGDFVIVNASEESNSIRAYDRKTGKLAWKRESSNLEGCATSPMLAGSGDESVVVVMLGGEVWGLEPTTGAICWRVETETRGGISPTPVADDDVVYTFGGSGESLALRFAKKLEEGDDRTFWKSKNLAIPSPVLHGDKIYLVAMSGMAACLNAQDGAILFDERLAGRTSKIYSSPVLAGGRLYVVSRKRGTFVYSADGKFDLLARNELDDDSHFNASPAVDGDRLFLRSDRRLYCISKS
ncbi:MAG: PQQ-binding-like beta-propeller repeat protein [Planctomycetes bacterium]|nr:PQQ-binding-like beta-propeller repeat protein [Planctomycetota bacterium]